MKNSIKLFIFITAFLILIVTFACYSFGFGNLINNVQSNGDVQIVIADVTQKPTVTPTTEPIKTEPATTQPNTTEPSTTEPPTENPDELKLDGMSLEQKAGQVVVCGIEGYEIDNDFTNLVKDKYIGGVILFKRNIKSAKQLTSLSNSIKNIAYDEFPLLIGMDEEGGNVSRLPKEVESLPSAYSIAQSGNDEYCYESGEIIGKQLSAFGISTGFSPVLDIWSNPDNTVIAKRAYGTTAEAVSEYAIEAMQGITSQNVISVGKHFPGHGNTLEDSHYSLPVVKKTKEELESFEFIPFKKAIENNIPAIMVGHLLCTEIDDKNPASLSKTIVTDILKDELNFDGVVFTDDLTMNAITDKYSIENASVMALNAGCDMLLVCHGYENAENAIDNIIFAVKNGELDEERLNDAVLHILKMKSKYNISNENIDTPDIQQLNKLTNDFTSKIF